MTWKQPITIEVYEWFGEDHLARDLFIHLLLRARNIDMETPNLYKRKPYQLKKGQVIFGRNEYAEKLRCSPSSCRKAKQRLQGVYAKVTSKSSTDYTVITILNYDELSSMKQASNKQRDKQKATNKNVSKNVKNEKSKDKYGEFVFLLPEEYKKLVDRYQEDFTKACIEKLDNTIGSTGDKWKSHYRTILNWVVRAVKETGEWEE